MTKDYIDSFSTFLDGIPLRVRYGVDYEDGFVYIINVMTRGDDDLMGVLSEAAIAELERQAKKDYAQVVKHWNDDAMIARAGD